MSKRRKPKTAVELVAELNQDRAYLERMAVKRQEHSERFGDAKSQITPVVTELRGIGYDVVSLDQLRRSGKEYRNAVPILIAWLDRVENPRAKEAIVHSLSFRWAKEAHEGLLHEFNKAPPSEELGLKWAIGNALSVLADEEILDALVELSLDSRHGRAREMIVEALGNVRNSRSIETLLKCLEDDQVAGHAVLALGRLRAVEALDRLNSFLEHPKPWIRDAAAKAIKQIMGEGSEKTSE
jgi:hypothetical protein